MDDLVYSLLNVIKYKSPISLWASEINAFLYGSMEEVFVFFLMKCVICFLCLQIKNTEEI